MMYGGFVFPPSLFLSTLTDMGAIVTLVVLATLFMLLLQELGAKPKGEHLAQLTQSPHVLGEPEEDLVERCSLIVNTYHHG